MGVGEVTPYGLDPRFAAQVAYLLCGSPRFFGLVGHAIEPDRLQAEHARLAATAARVIYAETGAGPKDPVIVLQRLRRWVDDGKLTLSDVERVGDMLDWVEDTRPPDVDAVVAELTPVLRQGMHHRAAKLAATAYGLGADMDAVVALIESAGRLGVRDVSIGSRLGMDLFGEIAAMRKLERFQTGIHDLDAGLGGGPGRGTLTVLIGDTGAGKSMMLSQLGATGLVQGMLVAYATLEVPRHTVFARTVAALTGVAIDEIDAGSARAQAALQQLLPVLGTLVVREFTADATSVADVHAWVEDIESHEQRPVDLLLTDYADKLGDPKARSGYDLGKLVYEGLRVGAHAAQRWDITASQSTRGSKGRKRVDLDDVADSMHKVRVPDLVITGTPRETVDGEVDIAWLVAKSRNSRSRWSVGPYTADFAHGLAAPSLLLPAAQVVTQGPDPYEGL